MLRWFLLYLYFPVPMSTVLHGKKRTSENSTNIPTRNVKFTMLQGVTNSSLKQIIYLLNVLGFSCSFRGLDLLCDIQIFSWSLRHVYICSI